MKRALGLESDGKIRRRLLEADRDRSTKVTLSEPVSLLMFSILNRWAQLLPLDPEGIPVPGTYGFHMAGEYRSDVWTIDDSGRVAITWQTTTRGKTNKHLIDDFPSSPLRS